MRITHTKQEYAALPGLILNALRIEPLCTVTELAARLHFGESGVRKTLWKLLDEDRVHFVQVRRAGGLGLASLWQYGPSPSGVKAEKQVRKPRAAAPVKSADASGKSYAPLHIRNEFETYFFGPAGAK